MTAVSHVCWATLWVYSTFFTSNADVQKELTDELGDEFFNFDMMELLPIVTDPNTTEALPNTDSEENERKENQEPENQDNPDPQPSTPSSGSENIAETPRPSVTAESIIAKHEPRSLALESIAIERLDTLFESGKTEHIRKAEDGTLDRFTLVNKYIQAGRSLEQGVDATFYTLLDELKVDLQNNDFSARPEAPMISVTTEESLTPEATEECFDFGRYRSISTKGIDAAIIP